MRNPLTRSGCVWLVIQLLGAALILHSLSFYFQPVGPVLDRQLATIYSTLYMNASGSQSLLSAFRGQLDIALTVRYWILLVSRPLAFLILCLTPILEWWRPASRWTTSFTRFSSLAAVIIFYAAALVASFFPFARSLAIPPDLAFLLGDAITQPASLFSAALVSAVSLEHSLPMLVTLVPALLLACLIITLWFPGSPAAAKAVSAQALLTCMLSLALLWCLSWLSASALVAVLPALMVVTVVLFLLLFPLFPRFACVISLALYIVSPICFFFLGPSPVSGSYLLAAAHPLSLSVAAEVLYTIAVLLLQTLMLTDWLGTLASQCANSPFAASGLSFWAAVARHLLVLPLNIVTSILPILGIPLSPLLCFCHWDRCIDRSAGHVVPENVLRWRYMGAFLILRIPAVVLGFLLVGWRSPLPAQLLSWAFQVIGLSDSASPFDPQLLDITGRASLVSMIVECAVIGVSVLVLASWMSQELSLILLTLAAVLASFSSLFDLIGPMLVWNDDISGTPPCATGLSYLAGGQVALSLFGISGCLVFLPLFITFLPAFFRAQYLFAHSTDDIGNLRALALSPLLLAVLPLLLVISPAYQFLPWHFAWLAPLLLALSALLHIGSAWCVDSAHTRWLDLSSWLTVLLWFGGSGCLGVQLMWAMGLAPQSALLFPPAVAASFILRALSLFFLLSLFLLEVQLAAFTTRQLYSRRGFSCPCTGGRRQGYAPLEDE